MHGFSGHPMVLEANLKRQQIEREAHTRRLSRLASADRSRTVPRWRAGAGRALMRLGARLAALDVAEHGRARTSCAP